ncbi:unnamed protein product [Camellia sinensis]
MKIISEGYCLIPLPTSQILNPTQLFSAAANEIYGSIPTGIENLVNLNSLTSYYNKLSGSLPTSICKLHKLQEVGIGKNKLSEKIPSCIGNLTLLNKLWLKQNNLEGSIPSNLDDNHLSGSIPIEVGNLRKLVKLNLSHNELFLRATEVLDLLCNNLSGEIPKTLALWRNKPIKHGNNFKALVFEFMPNGSLNTWLHPIPSTGVHREPKSLNLLQRINVAIDVASALDYLHNHCHTPIIHCDLKPSSILLDGDLTAHVSDFGLARFLKQHDNEISQSYQLPSN